MQNPITSDNWTFTHFALADMKVKISIGGEPTAETEAIKELYYVSVLDAENHEISQTRHSKLDDALLAINQGHQGWDFVDETLKPDGSGCGACVAH